VYDKAVVHALFRLYQTFPEASKKEVIVTGLLQALMALPSTDLLVLSYLLPFGMIEHEPQIKKIMEASDLLETGRFAEVWPVLEQEPCTSSVALKEEIRKFMLSNISRTCRSLPKASFCELLGIDQVQLGELAATRPEIESVQENLVVLVENAENRPRPRQYSENLRYEEVSSCGPRSRGMSALMRFAGADYAGNRGLARATCAFKLRIVHHEIECCLHVVPLRWTRMCKETHDASTLADSCSICEDTQCFVVL
jgi:hypothetical protein